MIPHPVLARSLAATIVLSAVLAAGTAAQNPPARPILPRQADENDWEAYFDRGAERIQRDGSVAEAAFYWASRLDPSRAEPLYARWIAFWLHDPDRFAKYVRDDEYVLRSPDVIRADSLRLRAFRRSPLVHQGLLMVLYDRLPGSFGDDVATRGWLAYARGDLPAAVERFGEAIDRDPRRYGPLRLLRASAFVNLKRPDSALVQLQALLAQLRAADAASLGHGYESKELLEYAVGMLYLQRQQSALAKEAFGRSVAENAAFAPAHAMLAELASSGRDTATALLEYGLAVEADPGDAVLRIGYARVLLAARRPADAAAQLREAVSAEPWYAAPYFVLGMALERAGDPAGAAAAYTDFLARAARGDALRPQTQQTLSALGGIVRK